MRSPIQSLLVAVFLSLAVSSAEATTSDDLDADFNLICGSTPTQSCALDYWTSATGTARDTLDYYTETANSEQFSYWCNFYPADCAQFTSDYLTAQATWNYSNLKRLYWGGEQ